MNEIEDMREALDRAELNLIRFRWLITNPVGAKIALETALRSSPIPSAEVVIAELDRARAAS